MYLNHTHNQFIKFIKCFSSFIGDVNLGSHIEIFNAKGSSLHLKLKLWSIATIFTKIFHVNAAVWVAKLVQHLSIAWKLGFGLDPLFKPGSSLLVT